MEKDKVKGRLKGERRRGEQEADGINIELELEELEHEVEMEGKSSQASSLQRTSESSVSDEGQGQARGVTGLELPKWVEYPWMYQKPSDARFVDSWFRDWSDLILKWSQFNVLHIVGLKDLATSKPLDKLPEKETRELLQHIVDRGLGKWVDKDKTAVRMMWRSLEEWAQDVYEWAYDNGIEMIDVFTVKSAKKDFASLPISDVREVMEIMIKRKMMRWVDKKHEQAKLIFQ